MGLAAAIALWVGACGDGGGGTPTPDTSADDTSPPDTTEPDTDTSAPDIVAPPCNSFQCVDGVAAECEGDLTLECGLFQAACTEYEGADGTNGWCDCGALAEDEVFCTGATEGVVCYEGLGVPFECVPGTTCREVAGVSDCHCDDAADGVCPGQWCESDPDCATCTPACGGRECGDNGCGGSCGTCGLGSQCAQGQCACTPKCEGKVCGGDGCGGSCGTCASGLTCELGQCLAGSPEAVDLGGILRVYAFTLSDTHIYFIGLGLDARPHAYRCPIGGCAGGTPQRISATNDRIDTLWTDIELAGDEVFWIEDDDEIRRANVAGATPGAVSLAWSGLSLRRPRGGLRSDDDQVFAAAVENGVGKVPSWVQIPGDGGDAQVSASRLSALESTSFTETVVFDVRAGSITAWSGGGSGERPIYSITGGDAQLVASASNLQKNTLVRLGSQVAWVGGQRLSVCGIGVSCDVPYVVSTSVGRSLAAGAGTLYFVEFEGGAHRLKACSSLDLLAKDCEPSNPSSGFEWAGATELRVHGDYVYAVTQSGGLIRARR